MAVVTIQDVGQHDGQEVTLRGWLYNYWNDPGRRVLKRPAGRI
jgi:hypothetical protein